MRRRRPLDGDQLTSVPETLTRDYYRDGKVETNTSVLLDALGVWRDENLEPFHPMTSCICSRVVTWTEVS